MNPITPPLFLYICLPLCAALLAVVLRRRHKAVARLREPEITELRDRLHKVLRQVPRRPPLLIASTATPLSLLVEARLLAGCPSLALEEAEHEVLSCPQDAGLLVALAKALLYCHREEEARAALQWAERLGADDAEFDYLRARLARPNLESLRLCVRACQREPGYPEALYLCARLCLRLGFQAEGTRLLRGIAPLMHLSVERLSYRRDLLQLAERSSPAQGPSLGEEQAGAARRLLRRLQLRVRPAASSASGAEL